MPTNRNHVPPRPTGDGPFGNGAFIRFMQAAWDRLWGAEGRFIDTSTVRVEQTTRGIAFHAAPQKASSRTPQDVSVKQVALIAVSADTLSVVEVDALGSPIGPLFVAIKPFKLRQSITSQVVDGITINYQYDNSVTRNAYIAGSFVETQIVIPRYNAYDSLLLVNLDGNYYDLNVDGRAWARKYV